MGLVAPGSRWPGRWPWWRRRGRHQRCRPRKKWRRCRCPSRWSTGAAAGSATARLDTRVADLAGTRSDSPAAARPGIPAAGWAAAPPGTGAADPAAGSGTPAAGIATDPGRRTAGTATDPGTRTAGTATDPGARTAGSARDPGTRSASPARRGTRLASPARRGTPAWARPAATADPSVPGPLRPIPRSYAPRRRCRISGTPLLPGRKSRFIVRRRWHAAKGFSFTAPRSGIPRARR